MNRKIIAVTGASGSGKSPFAETTLEEVTNVSGVSALTLIKEDAYYKSQDHIPYEERSCKNYDHPYAFEHDLLIKHLDDLKVGNPIMMPQYCYIEHTRKQERIEILPARVILVEGILLLSKQELFKRFDIKIFMDTPLDLCFVRRMMRDTAERGRDVESVIDQYIKTVRPMFYEFVLPQKEKADILVRDGGKNRVAIELLKAQIREFIN